MSTSLLLSDNAADASTATIGIFNKVPTLSTKKGHMRTVFLASCDESDFRIRLAEYFHSTFSLYESLFDTLVDEGSYRNKPISLRHPLIFYFGHTATFFVNKLILCGLFTARINPNFESLFAVGVDEMSWDDLNDAHYNWPTSAEVAVYRTKVREAVDHVIRNAPLQLPVNWNSPWWEVIMGIEHELIHLETSSVLIRQHNLARVRSVASWAPNLSGIETAQRLDSVPRNVMVTVPAGHVSLGKSHSDPFYGWDNEYGQREVDLPKFEASKYLVSNAEFLEFVNDGGYIRSEFWDEEGLAWLKFSKATAPTFWIHDGAEESAWKLRLMTQEVSMPWSWPVETNCLESRAFCRWKSLKTGRPHRLPTEDEWYRLYDVAGLSEVQQDKRATGNIHLDFGASSCPIDRFAHGEFFDIVGNVWQWTETPIYPFDGFDVHPFYDDFTTPTFDGRHNLIKGGSWVSCGNESLRSSRYAFRRHFFQHAGLRYVVNETAVSTPNLYYESDKQLSEFAEMHYGEECLGSQNFQKTVANIAIEATKVRPQLHALDIGCATGRACFELAKHFDRVTGVDFSARFINAGVQLKETGEFRYTRAEEGDLVSYQTRSLAKLGLADDSQKVEFFQGDACNLKSLFTGYDLIVAANLIDRLYDPKSFLAQIHERLNVGGILVISSPYTWIEEHTKREDWLGGFKKDGENWTTLSAMKDLLSPHFRMVDSPQDVPFVIREHRRKFHYMIAEVTIWERTA